ncbi:MAG: hypothetical protein V3S51_03640 [Dehalococcoidia bacterium]
MGRAIGERRSKLAGALFEETLVEDNKVVLAKPRFDVEPPIGLEAAAVCLGSIEGLSRT